MRSLFEIPLIRQMLGIPQVASANPLEDAAAAYQRGDYATALRLWRSLANQGHPYGQNNLGAMYAEGQGVPQDYIEAHKWFNLAEVAGDEYAARNRSFAESKMTREQIAEAQRRAAAWKPAR